MANTTPRRGQISARQAERKTRTATAASKRKPAMNADNEAPWNDGDPTRKIALNIPFPEPLILQLEYLIEHKAIFSKSAFIREAVAAAATAEVERFRKVRRVMAQIDKEDRR